MGSKPRSQGGSLPEGASRLNSRPFLIDTCVALWIVDGRVPVDIGHALTAAFNHGLQTFVSPITAWEIGQLARKRRFVSTLSPQRWFSQLMTTRGAALADMPPEVLMESSFLGDLETNDPADRIIAATAREYGYTVVTSDAALLDYGKRGHLSVLEC
ncbi:MAG: type II toxin-antitoxin system VapC family toxin [Hyphomonadaceae bacterium]